MPRQNSPIKEELDREFERDSATDDTRVKTAVAWLEEAALASREENRVRVFPSCLKIRTLHQARTILDRANITCNKNTVPFETRSPFQASGIRLGTPAVTSRGFLEAEMDEIADCIDLVLKAIGTDKEAAAIADSKQRVLALSGRHPLPYKL